jgi:sulfotransferase
MEKSVGKQLHAIGGLPRSGSTLLCNIINQNPRAKASSTSALPGFVRALSAVASERIEVRNLLDKFPDQTVARLNQSVGAFCAAWYGGTAADLVFDKSRGWNDQTAAFRDLNPGGVVFVIVRDLRAVFASVEKQDRKSGLLRSSPSTIADRYRAAFAPDGVIGAPYRGVMSIVDQRPPNVYFLRFEDLVRRPAEILANIYSRIGAEPFEHDFANVTNTAIDPDGFYLHKFPHEGSGSVEVRPETWPEILPDWIAADIMKAAAPFNEFFKYGAPPPNQQKPKGSPQNETENA